MSEYQIYLADARGKQVSYLLAATEESAGRARRKASYLYDVRDTNAVTHVNIYRGSQFYRRVG